MRDLLLTAIFGALLMLVFKHPVVGAYLWAWFSLMNPHKLAYGFAYLLPFAQIIALVTMAVLVFTRKRQAVPLTLVTGLWACMVVWMTVTSPFALNDRDVVFDRWFFVMKIHLMTLVTLMLVVTEEQLKRLVVIVTFSLCFFGIKGGIFTALTGGSYRVWGPPDGMLAGNNEFAVGLVMLIPMLYWLRQTSEKRWIRLGCTVSIVLCTLSVLGTQSRGALVAILAMALFLGIKSNHPVRFTLILMVGLGAAVAFMPDSWTQRMDSIGEYEVDESAQSRLWTWHTLWNVAVDRPLVGAGFRAEALFIFKQYAPVTEQGQVFLEAGKSWVAHSIYFQMLGEQGFPGLFFFLALWTAVWIRAGRLAKRADAIAGLNKWLPLLLRMTQVSLIGYAAGGAFLSLAYLDLPYYFMGYVVLGEIFIARHSAGLAVPGGVPPTPETSGTQHRPALPAARRQGDWGLR